VLKHIHLSEVYNAGGVAKAAPLAFSFLFLHPLSLDNKGLGLMLLIAPREPGGQQARIHVLVVNLTRLIFFQEIPEISDFAGVMFRKKAN
jgi:hypothetical protein